MSNDKMVINRACVGHNLDICAWISRSFDTVILLEELQCHLKHMLK